MALHVVFDCDSFIAVSKPHDIAFHCEPVSNTTLEESGGRSSQGFVSLVRQHYSYDTLYPVHRLDRVTSGLMVFAKSVEANSQLSKLFEQRKVQKQYIALSERKPKKKQGLISGDMVKARGGNYKLKQTHENPAVTRFQSKKVDSLWGFLLKPETGKTHQLRVACKALGSPILGDERYGGAESDRCYLHSYRISFELYETRYDLCAEPIDERLKACAEAFEA